MDKNDFFRLLDRYNFKLKAINTEEKNGTLYLTINETEICEILTTDFDKIKDYDFDNYILQFIIFNLSSIGENDINLEILSNRTLCNSFFAFQDELKNRKSVPDTNASQTLLVSKFSNATLFLLLGSIVLMAIIFEFRLQNKDEQFQKAIFDLQNQIANLQNPSKGSKKAVEQTQKEQKTYIKQEQPLFNVEQIGDTKELTNFLEERSVSLGIDPKIVKTIINIESNNKPFAMGIVSNKAGLIASSLSNNANLSITNKENTRFVSIVPQNKKIAGELFDIILSHQAEWDILSIDYGLMQVNHNTIVSYELEPKEIYLNPYYNIALGIDILKSCYNLFPKDQFNTIECYNKGVDKKRLDKSDDYYNKFITEYKRINL